MYLSGRGIRRTAKPCVHCLHIFKERLKLLVECFACGREPLFSFDRHRPRGHKLCQRVGALVIHTLKAELMLVKKLPDRRLNQACRESWLSSRCHSEDSLVQHRRLREVGYLCRTADDESSAE